MKKKVLQSFVSTKNRTFSFLFKMSFRDMRENRKIVNDKYTLYFYKYMDPLTQGKANGFST